tara:strand:+ start:166 stop:522 length:357 start_codon:yes stop_codon:yes gene_type:complete
MANPNILNATSIVGKNKGHTSTTSAVTLVTAGSNELIKIKSLIVANNSGQTGSAANLRWRDSSASTDYYIARELSVPQDASVMVIGEDYPVYLEENDYLQAWATNGLIDFTLIYEILT